jgi:hypothetical protein
MGRMTSQPKLARLAVWGFVASCAALALVGCTGGTLIGGQQSCNSNIGLLDTKKVSCTGSVETVRGSPSLSVIEIGEQLDGAFELETTIRVGRGTAKAYVTDIDDERVGGEVSPGEPLLLVAVVYPEEAGTEDEETVDVQLEVAEGEAARYLRYEATLVARD